MPARFYAPHAFPGGGPVRLPDDEAHHVAHVMRLGVGHVVHIFDGRGHEYRAEVLEVSRRGVVVQPHEAVAAAQESPFGIVLAQAVLKGDRMDAVVRDATMMGVAAIRPTVTDHVAVPSRALGTDRLAARWRRIALGSAKQCGRAVVPDVAAPVPLSEVLRDAHRVVMLVEPRHAAVGAPDLAARLRDDSDLVLLVGPEGGWSDAELELARESEAGLWSLGPRVLRADAAALVALSILAYLADAPAPRRPASGPMTG